MRVRIPPGLLSSKSSGRRHQWVTVGGESLTRNTPGSTSTDVGPGRASVAGGSEGSVRRGGSLRRRVSPAGVAGMSEG